MLRIKLKKTQRLILNGDRMPWRREYEFHERHNIIVVNSDGTVHKTWSKDVTPKCESSRLLDKPK